MKKDLEGYSEYDYAIVSLYSLSFESEQRQCVNKMPFIHPSHCSFGAKTAPLLA
jgi:hypothetical protein